MTWLPQFSWLGQLSMEETYLTYDGPRLFAARSLTDQLYLVAWVDHTDEGDQWLYAPVSGARLAMVRSGGMPVRDAFQHPESPFLVSVVLPYDGGEDGEPDDEVTLVAPSAIDESWFPSGDLTLDLPTATLPAADTAEVISLRAAQENRTRLRLRVKLPEYVRSEAPARKIGELLALTQTVLDNIGLALESDHPAQRGRIPREIADETESVLVGAAAASFVVELASNKLEDLLGGSLFARSTQLLLGLFDIELTQDLLTAQLSVLGPRGAKSFRSFVGGLASTGGDVTLAAAGAHFAYQRRYLPQDRLSNLVVILKVLVPDDEPVEVRRQVTFFRIDTDRKAFGARDVSSEDTWEGSVQDQAMPGFERANATDPFDVLILETRVLDETVGDVKRYHALAQLSPAAQVLGTTPATQPGAEPVVD